MVHVLVLQNGPKRKKATMNPKDKYGKCFQYAITVALNYREIESYPERVSNINRFINKYKWKGINYSPKTDYWQTFEENNRSILFNTLQIKPN